jgi:hypothetical protein
MATQEIGDGGVWAGGYTLFWMHLARQMRGLLGGEN